MHVLFITELIVDKYKKKKKFRCISIKEGKRFGSIILT